MKTYYGKFNKQNHTWEAFVNGMPLDSRFDLANHSPDGFSWGYSGSGPAQLALAILADYLRDDNLALKLYQKFKFAFISSLDKESDWSLSSSDLSIMLAKIQGFSVND